MSLTICPLRDIMKALWRAHVVISLLLPVYPFVRCVAKTTYANHKALRTQSWHRLKLKVAVTSHSARSRRTGRFGCRADRVRTLKHIIQVSLRSVGIRMYSL